MNKTIVIILFILAAAVGIIWLKGPVNNSSVANSGSGSASVLTVDSTLYDFGTISMAKGNVNHMFTVKNLTGKDITLKRLETSCMCTTAYLLDGAERKGPFGMPGMSAPVPLADEVIKAGKSKQVEAVYDPAAHGPAGVGAIDRFITLTDSNGGTLQLEIKADVTP